MKPRNDKSKWDDEKAFEVYKRRWFQNLLTYVIVQGIKNEAHCFAHAYAKKDMDKIDQIFLLVPYPKICKYVPLCIEDVMIFHKHIFVSNESMYSM